MSRADFISSVRVLIEEVQDRHRQELYPDIEGHTSLGDEGADDVECLTCGHINEADYELLMFEQGLGYGD